MTVPPCTHWLGHKFEARFSEGSADSGVVQHHQLIIDPIGVLKATKPRTYERDVCVRCGATIEKAKP